MPQLESTTKGPVQIVRFTAERITNEPAIQALGEELLGILNHRQGSKNPARLWGRAVHVLFGLGNPGPAPKKVPGGQRSLEVLQHRHGESFEIFKITKLHRVFEIHPTQKEALAAFAK